MIMTYPPFILLRHTIHKVSLHLWSYKGIIRSTARAQKKLHASVFFAPLWRPSRIPRPSGGVNWFSHIHRHIKPVIGVQNKTSPKPIKGYLGIDAKARKTTLYTCVAAPSDLGLSIFQEVLTAILTRIARLPSVSHIISTRLHHHRGRQVLYLGALN